MVGDYVSMCALFCPSIGFSIHLADLPISCLCNCSSIFVQTCFKLCRICSYDMKMYMWFWNFDSTVFYTVITHIFINFAHQKSFLCNSSYMFRQIHLTSFGRIWRYASGFRFLIWLFQTKLSECLPTLTWTLSFHCHAGLNFFLPEFCLHNSLLLLLSSDSFEIL